MVKQQVQQDWQCQVDLQHVNDAKLAFAMSHLLLLALPQQGSKRGSCSSDLQALVLQQVQTCADQAGEGGEVFILFRPVSQLKKRTE